MREYKNSEIAHCIDEYCHNERNRAILKARLIDGLSYDQLADKFFLSVRRIKTIVYTEGDRALKHLPE